MMRKRGTPCRPFNPTTDPLCLAPVGVLIQAVTLAAERYSGRQLQSLDEQQKRDLYIEAVDRLERYKEQ